MRITEETMRKITGLVKINLTEAEQASLALDIESMLRLADKLGEADTDGVAETSHAALLQSVYREDIMIRSPSRDKMLANAPERDETSFLTPKVLD
ncbi:MAG: Asp-tRNA(Asn)/Glu-tRNA(Gln) amidotransferase subunit GatC [Clostridiales bacterium]|nr:Asp-tRNA(Asn)/Glu-tRNA(Gln) amidotransferase subunit GatC [Clostridiales bacterium]